MMTLLRNVSVAQHAKTNKSLLEESHIRGFPPEGFPYCGNSWSRINLVTDVHMGQDGRSKWTMVVWRLFAVTLTRFDKKTTGTDILIHFPKCFTLPLNDPFGIVLGDLSERQHWFMWKLAWIKTLRPRQHGRYFPDDIFKCILLNENIRISIKISLKFDPEGSIDNIPALV